MVWSGFEIGIAATFPWQSVVEDFEKPSPNLVKQAYLAYAPEQPHDRPTWDLTAVLQAAYPDRGYFQLSPPGRVTVTEDGATFYAADGKGRDRYLIMNPLAAARVREALTQLVSDPVPTH